MAPSASSGQAFGVGTDGGGLRSPILVAIKLRQGRGTHFIGKIRYFKNSGCATRPRVYRTFALWLPRDAGGIDDIQPMLAGGTEVLVLLPNRKTEFDARMDELIPSFSGVLLIRIGIFAERVIGEMLLDLMREAKKVLQG
jgi:hypothetical protein